MEKIALSRVLRTAKTGDVISYKERVLNVLADTVDRPAVKVIVRSD